MNMNEKFTGTVHRGNETVAIVEDDQIVSVSEQAPIYLRKGGDFTEWLTDRGADTNRSYIRILLKQLRLPQMNILQGVKFVNAACITDTFWIKPKNKDIGYKDTIFHADNPYFKASLQGDADIYELPVLLTPEVTNIGSFNKGWKNFNGEWFLYKTGSALEIFSELFTSNLAVILGLDAVQYYMDSGFVVSKNFVPQGFCFEHAKSLIGEDTSYKKNLDVFTDYGLQKEYLDLIFMDAIVRNGDRHEFNYGVMTDSRGVIKMAPNFDNNLSLFHNGVPSRLARNDVMVTDFIEILDYADYKIPVMTAEILNEAINKSMDEYPVNVDKEVVFDFCMNAYLKIINRL